MRALLPQLRASISPAIDLGVLLDRTTTIRASFRDVQITLLISIGLVVLVVFLFLHNGWATIIPSVAVPLSLLGTFGGMYLCGYSLDNLSLMALTISTGFVVDDAIVVLENITRYLEAGVPRLEAALRGAREISFTVLSMSISLVAVFIPILLMGGLVGKFLMAQAGPVVWGRFTEMIRQYKAPPACAVKDARPRYKGESRFPLILQNVHRIFFYLIIPFPIILGWDAIRAFDFPEADINQDIWVVAAHHPARHLVRGSDVHLGGSRVRSGTAICRRGT